MAKQTNSTVTMQELKNILTDMASAVQNLTADVAELSKKVQSMDGKLNNTKGVVNTSNLNGKSSAGSKKTSSSKKSSSKSDDNFDRAKYEAIAGRIGAMGKRGVVYRGCRRFVYNVMDGTTTEKQAKAQVEKWLAEQDW